MRTIETCIDIAAPAVGVWSLLTDFASYPNWNPFITSIIGTAQEGARLRVHIRPPGRKGMGFSPKVVTVLAGQQLTWLGHLLLPGLFDGRHSFRIEEQRAGCRFHQSEEFSGLLVPLFGSTLLESTKLGFASMNAALKRRAELPTYGNESS